MDNWKDYRKVFFTLVSPGSLWLVVFFLIPMAFLFVLSFSEKATIDGVISATEYNYVSTFSNYMDAAGWNYLVLLWRAVLWSAIATFICLILAYPLAFGISFAPQKWRPLLLLLLILPFWINLLIRTYALMQVLRTQGLLNQFLGIFGIGPFEMLYNSGAVILGLIYCYLPFMVLPLYSTVERLDKSYLEASLDLGATQATTFWRVTLPLTMPGVITGIILVFIPCLGSFLTSDLLGGPNSWTIGNAIQNQFGSANNWPFGAALSFILMFATFLAMYARHLFALRSKGVDA
ncbi:ABC transporter permease [Aestuariivirga litoralis]|uniref:ABC transporter permease n=1 Tax=Aestuariivirga litoralis TaxID=2650924 RepID=UPI001FEDA35B|nr:ABC transporter permease [Aestuariivirga litoralis]MBG1232070.1 ABC transporter permease [Aestuariivirga litoralis]